MKIRGISKDRSPKPLELGDVTVWIKPADQNMRTTFTSRAMSGTAELVSKADKKYFARTHVTDWEGIVDDESGNPVEFDEEQAIAALTDDQNDDFFYECFNFAYKLASASDEAQEKDKEAAKKK